MTYKKILSAALAAAMVVGTASVSMASTTDAWIDYSGTIYYLDSNGWLQPSDDYEIKPGESFYIAINHDGTLSSSSAKRYRIYTDWSHGKNYVTDTEIVYKKANKVGTFYTVVATVSGLPSATMGDLNKQYSLTGLTYSQSRDDAYIKSEVRKLVNAGITDAMRNTIKGEKFEQESGYLYGGKIYTNAQKDTLLAAVGYKETSGKYVYDGKEYDSEADALTAIKNTLTAVIDPIYSKDSTLSTEAAAITANFTTEDYSGGKPDRLTDNTKITLTALADGGYLNETEKKYYGNIDALKTALSITIEDLGTMYAASAATATPANGTVISATQDSTYDTLITSLGVKLTQNGEIKFYDTVDNAAKSLGYVAVTTSTVDSFGKIDTNNTYYTKDEYKQFPETTGYINGGKVYTATEAKAELTNLGYTKYIGGWYTGNKHYADDDAIKADYTITAPVAGFVPVGGGTTVTNLTDITGVTAATNAWRDKTSFVAADDATMTAYVQNTITSAVNSLGITVNSPEQVQSRSIASKYDYFVEVSTKPDTTAKTFDIVGEVMIGTSKTNAQRYVADVFVTLSNGAYDDGEEVYGDVSIDSTDADSVVKFAKDAGEIYINWGDEAAMIVNVNGQSSLNLKYSVRFDNEFADKHGYTNMDFLSFPAEPKFNRTGTFFIYADEDKYIYKKTDSGAEEISNLKYNDEEEAWEIRTNRLESYVIADDELIMIDDDDNIVAPTPSVPEVPTAPGLKPNPPTGR